MLLCHGSESPIALHMASPMSPPPPPPQPPASSSVHAEPTFSPPAAGTTDNLGISLNTFRALQELQAREITPDDYELLMTLHAKPATKTLDEAQLANVTESFQAEAMQTDTCAVCLGPMEDGEVLSRLACSGRHVYHRHCITEWLRTASCRCPVDQHDLSTVMTDASCLPADRL